MKIKILLTILASLWLTMVINPLASTHNGWYLHDSDGNPIRDGYGRCVFAVLGNMIEECEDNEPLFESDETPEPIKTMAPAPIAAPIVEIAPITKAPQPRPISVAPVKPPAPAKPKIEILNLNEAGGSNFTTASSELSINAQNLLNGLIHRIKTSGITPSNVTIIGHTDNRGSESYNQKLSLQRAQSVAIYLASVGIDPRVIHVSGNGESQPIADNNTQSGRATNRRVAIRVTGNKPTIK